MSIETLSSSSYLRARVDDLSMRVADAQRRLHDQRGCLLKETNEVRQRLDELGQVRDGDYSHIAEVIRSMGPDQALVKVMPDGPKMVVHLADGIDPHLIHRHMRVALSKEKYILHKLLGDKEFDPVVQLMKVEHSTGVTYDQLGGLAKQIQEVKEVVELSMKHPDLFELLGISVPHGLLLYGPPGTGKTTLARAVAHHCDCTFICISGAELVQKYIGQGTRLVREVFAMARRHAPAIIFLDQIDVLSMKRDDPESDREVQRTLLELLNQLDGFDRLDNIRVIAATNRRDLIYHSFVRPGRIDRAVELPYPNEQGRLEILRIHSRKMSLSADVNLRRISAMMEPKTSGADIKAICMEAGMYAVRELRSFVVEEDFRLAVAKVSSKHHERNSWDGIPLFQ